MAEQLGNWDLKWEMLVADSWDDPELKQRLLSDPATVLKERGMNPPEGVSISVVEDTADAVHLVLPQAPAADELSDSALERVAGGSGYNPSYCYTDPIPGRRMPK